MICHTVWRPAVLRSCNLTLALQDTRRGTHGALHAGSGEGHWWGFLKAISFPRSEHLLPQNRHHLWRWRTWLMTIDGDLSSPLCFRWLTPTQLFFPNPHRCSHLFCQISPCQDLFSSLFVQKQTCWLLVRKAGVTNNIKPARFSLSVPVSHVGAPAWQAEHQQGRERQLNKLVS